MLRPNSLMFLFALLSYILEYQRSNSVTLEVLLGHRIQNTPYPSLYFTFPSFGIQFSKSFKFSKNHMGGVMTTCSAPTPMALGSRYIILLYSLFWISISWNHSLSLFHLVKDLATFCKIKKIREK